MKKKSVNFLENIAIEIISWLLVFLSKFIYFSCRKEIIGHEKIEYLENSPEPFIYAFWHGRLYPMNFLYTKKKKVHAIISNHVDGEIIARIISKFGVYAVRGSTNRMPDKDRPFKNRGGTFVIRESIRIFKEGNVIAITPDGPKGPVRKVKKNLFKTVLEKNISIALIGFSASRSICFSSWDNFMLPMPFSKIVITMDYIKNPLEEFNKYELDEFALKIEESLNNITAQADKISNHRHAN